MDIKIKFREASADVVEEDGVKVINWKPAISVAAYELKVLDPGINTDSEAQQIENMLGDVMTPPNEFGYSTVRLSDVKRIVITEAFLKGLSSCQLILGDTGENKPVLDTKGEPVLVEIKNTKGEVIGTKPLTEVISGGVISGSVAEVAVDPEGRVIEIEDITLEEPIKDEEPIMTKELLTK